MPKRFQAASGNDSTPSCGEPELAECVPALTARLDPDLGLELQTLYTAAVYLQRNWLSRLRIYLNSMELLTRPVFTPVGTAARRRNDSAKPGFMNSQTLGKPGRPTLSPVLRPWTIQSICSSSS